MEKLGLPIDQRPEDRRAVTRKLGAFQTSMLQDVEANKPWRLTPLVGAVRELGQITYTPTPHTDALLGLVRLMARTRGLYGAANKLFWRRCCVLSYCSYCLRRSA